MAKVTVKIPEKVKILAINFSPRKDGITSEMMKECLSWAENYGYVESEYIDAADYDFYPCKGTACLKCWGFKAPANATKPQCYEHPNDGVNVIMPKTLEADGLLIGFPIHARGVPSTLRIFQEKDLQINSPLAFSKWAGARRYRTVGVICQGMGVFGGQEIVYDQVACSADTFSVRVSPTADAPAPLSSPGGGKLSTISGMPMFDRFSYKKEASVTVPPAQGSKNQRTLKNLGRWMAVQTMFMKVARDGFKESGLYAPTMQPYTEYYIKPDSGSYVEKLMKEGKVKYVSEEELRARMEATA